MQKKNLIKRIIMFILQSLRNILSSFFGFFFSIFIPKKKTKKTGDSNYKLKIKKKKLDNDNGKVEDIVTIPDAGDKELLRENKSTNFFISIPELKETIFHVYAEMLEIEEHNLTETQKEIIILVQEKIIPKIINKIEKKEIVDDLKLKEELQIIIEEEIIEILIVETKYESTSLLPVKEYSTKRKRYEENKQQEKSEDNNVAFSFREPETKLEPEETIPAEITHNKAEPLKSELNLDNKIEKVPDKNSNNMVLSSINRAQAESVIMPSKVQVFDDVQASVKAPETLEEISIEVEDIPEMLKDTPLGIDRKDTPDILVDWQEPNNLPPDINEVDNLEVIITPILDVVDAKLDEKPENLSEPIVIEPELQVLTEELQEPEPQSKSDNEKEEEIVFTKINFKAISLEIDSILKNIITEKNKENLEDKDYDKINNRLELLMSTMLKYSQDNLSPESRTQLESLQNKVFCIFDNLDKQIDNDVRKEQSLLQEYVDSGELNKLNEEVKKLYLENQIDLNEHMLEKLEDLNSLTSFQAERIEKELLKEKLRKAAQALEITSIMFLPFTTNEYFLLFTAGFLVSKHLGFFHNILKRKTVPFAPEELNYLKNGQDSLDNAFDMNSRNIEYLNYLESEALKKYPDLAFDNEFILYIESLRNSLSLQTEKMLKKKNMLDKYNLKRESYTRTLKRNDNAA